MSVHKVQVFCVLSAASTCLGAISVLVLTKDTQCQQMEGRVEVKTDKSRPFKKFYCHPLGKLKTLIPCLFGASQAYEWIRRGVVQRADVVASGPGWGMACQLPTTARNFPPLMGKGDATKKGSKVEGG